MEKFHIHLFFLVSGEPFDPFDRLRAGRLRALRAVSRDSELINKKPRPQGQRRFTVNSSNRWFVKWLIL